jgi:hypothetical protein
MLRLAHPVPFDARGLLRVKRATLVPSAGAGPQARLRTKLSNESQYPF